jgi:hypothetical protein
MANGRRGGNPVRTNVLNPALTARVHRNGLAVIDGGRPVNAPDAFPRGAELRKARVRRGKYGPCTCKKGTA